MRFIKIFIISIVIFLLVGEVAMRLYGFCDSPLIEESVELEYIAQPNQKRFRFGKNIFYNSYSQRSEEPQGGTLKILALGDSVINGGVQTDQKDLATTILSSNLSAHMNMDVQVLNISAGSWGPDNCAKYLEKYGLFGARAILLVCSSHDAFDNMDWMPTVGVSVSFPNQQYLSAWVELFERYLIPQIRTQFTQKRDVNLGINKKGKLFNTGFAELKEISENADIPLVIWLHPEISELQDGKYNEQGELIIQFCTVNNISLIRGLELGINSAYYRDDIHINEMGHRFMAEYLTEYLTEYFVFRLNSNCD